MVNAPTSESASSESLQGKPVYIMAAVCLALGLVAGYLFGGLHTSASGTVSAAHVGHAGAPASVTRMPTLDDMKRMADKQAAPLLAQLSSNPSDSALLSQVATIYHGSHQFKEAAGYYAKAVQADPKDMALRNKLASSLYRSGDVDGALEQLSEGLRYDATDANSLFNLGMIRLQGKGDAKGALAAWQRLLKSNPQLGAERRAEVQKLMADVLTTMGNEQKSKGALGK